MMNTNKISFDKAVVNLLNGDTYLFNCKFGDTSTVFTIDDDALTINLAFSKKDENGEYKRFGGDCVQKYLGIHPGIFINFLSFWKELNKFFFVKLY